MYTLEYYQNRRTAIEKNRDTDLFCLECFQANPLTVSHCLFCDDPPVGNRIDALEALAIKIEEVRQQNIQRTIRSYGHSVPHHRDHDDDQDSMVHVYLDNSLVYSGSSKRARKFLRSRGLSITNGRKEGSNWYL